MLTELTNSLLDRWDRLFPEVKRPQRIHYLGIPGAIEGGTTTFLAFNETSNLPAFVVKVARHSDGQSIIVNEGEILRFLHTTGKPIERSVPKLVLCENVGGSWVLVESTVEGRPMAATMGRSGLPNLRQAATNFHLACKWLQVLHHATRESGAEELKAAQNDAIHTIEEFVSTFDLSGEERAYLQGLKNEVAALAQEGLCLRHGDFCRQNILLAREDGGQRADVVDWSWGRRIALPLHDLFFFFISYFLQVRRTGGLEGFAEAFRYTFFYQNPYRNLVKQHVGAYCSRLGIHPSHVKALFAICLVDQAVLEYRKVLACSRRGELPRFSVYLANEDNISYPEVLKRQLWRRFFELFVKDQERFNL